VKLNKRILPENTSASLLTSQKGSNLSSGETDAAMQEPLMQIVARIKINMELISVYVWLFLLWQLAT
jgi:hypothetical protein